jgi:hypothetical protein
VTRDGSNIRAIQSWAKAMYVLNLGSIAAVERALSFYSAAGAFRHFIKHSDARWCYAGTFFWMKHSTLFSRAWQSINKERFGVEGYPGRHLRWGELAPFNPDNITPEKLYRDFISDKVIEGWKKYWEAAMHTSVLEFLKADVTRDDIKGKDLLEVGSYDVNGTPRTVLDPLEPHWYLGVDAQEGPCVDRVVQATELVQSLGNERFDVVLSTEMLEHVRDWKKVIHELKCVLKVGGLLILTTRSPGFPYHPYPEDHWRFTVEDFKKIFSELEILELKADPQFPGVFLKARKTAPTEARADLNAMVLAKSR